MKFCVIIPAHNEARCIGYLVENLTKKSLDVVVIDDGSLDDTALIARNKGAEVIRIAQKQGKGHALRRGFEYALTKQYCGIVTMDGDGQHSIDDLGSFLELAKRDSRMIICGNRMKNVKSMPFSRYLVNYVMSLLISMACRQRIPDTQCGYRYISLEALKQLPLNSEKFEIETEVLIKAAKAKIPILSVPVQTIYGDENSKIRPIRDTLRFLRFFIAEILAGNNDK